MGYERSLIDKIDKTIALNLQKEYEKKLQANKKELYTLFVADYKVRTYIYIDIELNAKDTLSIFTKLQEDKKSSKMNSKHSSKFTQGMTKKQVIQKMLEIYGLSKKKVKILKTDITLNGVKWHYIYSFI